MAINQRGFNISDFRALVTKNGIARSNQYKIIMPIPAGLSPFVPGLTDVNAMEDIMLYAESIQLPGLSLATSQIRNNGYGPVEMKPYMPVFGQQLSVTFYVDTKGLMFDFFHTWMRSIVNYTTEGKSYTHTRFNYMYPFEVNYKPNYQIDMSILVLDPDNGGKIVKEYRVVKAYPMSISDIQMSYGLTDSILTLQVTFSYFEWFTRRLATPSVIPGPNLSDDGVGTPWYNPDDPLYGFRTPGTGINPPRGRGGG